MVTSAAVVMVAVFAIFATLALLDFKQMGVGLAVAVLIDATIVRAVLLPATMKLLGEWNWYLPAARVAAEGLARRVGFRAGAADAASGRARRGQGDRRHGCRGAGRATGAELALLSRS